MTKQFVVIAEFRIASDDFSELLDICIFDSERSLADEEGCIAFDVLQPRDATSTVILHEVYRDEAAFNAHTKTPHFKKVGETLRTLSLEYQSIRTFRVVDAS